MEQRSFILGMVTAFSECVAAGCKDLALSPPLDAQAYEAVASEAVDIIQKHGLIAYHEENLDLPEEERFDWILIVGRQQVLDEYLVLRAKGLSPARSLAPFATLLSYNEQKRIHTGYDAYRTFFPQR